MMTRPFRDRHVLVTGAAGGLGRALCHRFAAAGARIGALDLHPEPLQALAGELSDVATAVATANADIAEEGACRRAIDALRDELGPVDVLINNAGITHLRNFQGGESAAIRRVMDVNFMGSVHCTDAAMDDLLAGRGMIITLSSIAGFAPLIGRSGYCASKHALHGFFNTLRLELRHSGVDVMLVCPSFIRTGIRRDFENRGPQDGNPDDGRRQSLGKGASPESVAELIFQAARRRKRQITTGALGHLSYWATRLVPRFYEAMMVRRIRDEP
jgi:NAD(P)-dependent dehydrogenase (short-subunit alcohol dehydrogenase family)